MSVHLNTQKMYVEKIGALRLLDGADVLQGSAEAILSILLCLEGFSVVGCCWAFSVMLLSFIFIYFPVCVLSVRMSLLQTLDSENLQVVKS